MLRRLIFAVVLVVSLLGPPLLSTEAGGSGNAGIWLETWDSEVVDYCADTRYYVTPLNEPFVFSVMPGGVVFQVEYLFSTGPAVILGRAANGSLIYSQVTPDWIQLIEAVPSGTNAYRVTSTFWRTDGSCVISNQAWWTYGTSADICSVWAFRDGNRRNGPGTQNTVVGNLSRTQWMQAIGQGLAPDGVLWYWLIDGSWVSSRIALGVGNCNF